MTFDKFLGIMFGFVCFIISAAYTWIVWITWSGEPIIQIIVTSVMVVLCVLQLVVSLKFFVLPKN